MIRHLCISLLTLISSAAYADRSYSVADLSRVVDLDEGTTCLRLVRPKASDVVVSRSEQDSSQCVAWIRINYLSKGSRLLVGYDGKNQSVWESERSVSTRETFEYTYPNRFFCKGPTRDFDKDNEVRARAEVLARATAFYSSNVSLICP